MFKFFEKPDHPMYDMAEARRLLAELPQDDPRKALEDITFWLDSIKEAAGFAPEVRLDVVMLLDEAAQPLQAALLQHYLDTPHLQDFQGLHLWRGMHAAVEALAGAYAACAHEHRRIQKKPAEMQARMPLLCVRWLRALAGLMKLNLMRYTAIEPATWQALGEAYRFAEAEACAESMVVAYPGHVIHTSPQRELLCALVLDISSPETLAADQIEVCYRIAGRMSSFFELKPQPDAASPWLFDLDAGSPPRRMAADVPPTAGVRGFSAVKALTALAKIIDQNESDPVWQERRFGSEFTPAGKLTVLRHLRLYWGQEPPHRHQERRGISAAIEVAHGFRTVSHLVRRIEPDSTMAQDEAAMRLAGAGEVKYDTEQWIVCDASADGIGATFPQDAGAWIKIGDLCAIRPQNGALWWVAMIRRLHANKQGVMHVGLEILAKKPLSVWLRALGKGAEKASNWETSSGSFEYSYQPVILLPDAQGAWQHATMLMESGSYVNGNLYQAMMGEKSRDIRLASLIAEGEDYEQVGFEWMAPAAA